jgi:hypothetical protein
MKKPDFSGSWKFNPTKSQLEIPPPDSTVVVIDHREPIFRLSRTHTVGGKVDTFAVDLTTDGNSVAIEKSGMRMHARLWWEGQTLVFDTAFVRGNEEATNLVRYELVEARNTILARESFRSTSVRYDNIWVMERQ